MWGGWKGPPPSFALCTCTGATSTRKSCACLRVGGGLCICRTANKRSPEAAFAHDMPCTEWWWAGHVPFWLKPMPTTFASFPTHPLPLRSGRAAKANVRFLEGKDVGWLEGASPILCLLHLHRCHQHSKKLRLSAGGWWPVHMSICFRVFRDGQTQRQREEERKKDKNKKRTEESSIKML